MRSPCTATKSSPRSATRESPLAATKTQLSQKKPNKQKTTTMKYHLTRVRMTIIKKSTGGFPGGAVVENLPANAGDTGLSPGLGRSHVPQSN